MTMYPVHHMEAHARQKQARLVAREIQQRQYWIWQELARQRAARAARRRAWLARQVAEARRVFAPGRVWQQQQMADCA
jgi:hypothetical protein